MSDTRTTEQRAADEALHDAINRVVNLQDRDPEHTQAEVFVTDFIVSAHCVNLELIDGGRSQYAYVTKNSGHGADASATHVILGLLRMACRWFED